MYFPSIEPDIDHDYSIIFAYFLQSKNFAFQPQKRRYFRHYSKSYFYTHQALIIWFEDDLQTSWKCSAVKYVSNSVKINSHHPAFSNS